MKKHITLSIIGLILGSSAQAQTPTQNLMPDGSRDMYWGLGVISRPQYEGATSRKVAALPLLQMQWSNGLFVAGMGAGWHLSSQPKTDFGPMLLLDPGRSVTGTGNYIVFPLNTSSSLVSQDKLEGPNRVRLTGLEEIHGRILGGFFFNQEFGREWSQTNTLLMGAGNDRHGVKLNSEVRYLLSDLSSHHKLSLGIGVNVVNQSYARSFFGVTAAEAARSTKPAFDPNAGVKDVYGELRWNWHFDANWMLTSKLHVGQFAGSVKNSPLVEQKTTVTVSTAVAYRF